MKKLSFVIDETGVEFLDRNFKSAAGGTNFLLLWAANTLPRVTDRAMARFGERERVSILAAHQGHVLSPVACGPGMLAMLVADSLAGDEDDVGAENGIEGKLQSLTETEAMAVSIWAARYWLMPAGDRPDVTEYVRGGAW